MTARVWNREFNGGAGERIDVELNSARQKYRGIHMMVFFSRECFSNRCFAARTLAGRIVGTNAVEFRFQHYQ